MKRNRLNGSIDEATKGSIYEAQPCRINANTAQYSDARSRVQERAREREREKTKREKREREIQREGERKWIESDRRRESSDS